MKFVSTFRRLSWLVLLVAAIIGSIVPVWSQLAKNGFAPPAPSWQDYASPNQGNRVPANLVPPRNSSMVGHQKQIPPDVPVRSTKGVKGFAQPKGRVQIGTTDAGAAVPEQVVNITQANGDYIEPFWSSDEQYIYFVQSPKDATGKVTGNYQIYRVAAGAASASGATTVQTPFAVTADPNSSFSFPAVDQNQTRILFTRSVAGGANQLYVAPLNSNGSANLTVGAGIISITDGRTIAPGSTVKFAEVQRAQFLSSNTIVFSARLDSDPAGAFHLWQVDINQGGQFTQLTSGNAVELNPAVGPSLANGSLGIVAFDSNANPTPGLGYTGRGIIGDPAIFNGTVNANRNVFILSQSDPAALPPQAFTNPQTGIDSVEPAWSTTRTAAQINAGGTDVYLAFASKRRDVRGNADDPTQITAFAPTSTYDIYYAKALDPTNNQLYSEAPIGVAQAPFTSFAKKLDTGDPNYAFNDEYPAWPQYISILRMVHQSDRTGTYKKTDGFSDPIGSGFTLTPGVHNLFVSTLVDITAPTILRHNPTAPNSEFVHINVGSTYTDGVSARTPTDGLAPGVPVFFTVRMEDRESGMAPEKSVTDPNNKRGAVFLQFKNPNSQYQQGGVEHKEWTGIGALGPLTTSENTITRPKYFYINWDTRLRYGWEYECQAISAADRSTYFYHNATVSSGFTTFPAQLPLYNAGVDDAAAFSGFDNPPLDGGTYKNSAGATVTTPNVYLRLNRLPDSQQDTRGGVLYGATWVLPDAPSDWYVDVIAYDNAVNPFNTAQRQNWIIYDNIWGFTTAPFSDSANILFVSDYTLGQKFLGTRFGSSTQTGGAVDNLVGIRYGAESYLTDTSIARLPQLAEIATLPPVAPITEIPYSQQGPFLITVPGPVGHAGGGWNYGLPNPLGVNSYADEYNSDQFLSGHPYPSSGQYVIWRTLARGPVTPDTLTRYLPRTGVATYPDIQKGETAPRTVTVANRMVVWSSPFAGDLSVGAGTIIDPDTQTNLTTFVNGGGRLFIEGSDIAQALSAGGGTGFLSTILKAQFVRDGTTPGVLGVSADVTNGAPNNYIAHDAWTADHAYGMFTTAGWVYYAPDAAVDGIFNDPFNIANTAASRGDGSPIGRTSQAVNFLARNDIITPLPAAFTKAGDAYHQLAYSPGGEIGLIASDFPTSGGKVAFASFGFESLSNEFYSGTVGTVGEIFNYGRRAELMHNITCSFRTGTITGLVTNASQGASPVANALVRAVPLYAADQAGASAASQGDAESGKAKAAYVAATDANGRFTMTGMAPGSYYIIPYRRGYALQRSSVISVHGGATTIIQVNTTLVAAPPGNITGKVLAGDRVTGIAGIEVQARAVNLDGTFDVSRAVTGADGSYTIRGIATGNYTLIANPNDVTDPKDPRFNANYNPTFTANLIADSAANTKIIAGPEVVFNNGQIQVSAGLTDNISFVLNAPPVTVTGFVYELDPNNPTQPLKDANGNPVPVAGATVVATQVDLNGKTVTIATVTTDATGKYTIPNVPEGATTITATQLGFATTNNSVTISSKATAPNILLQRLPPGKVSGLVTNRADNSVAAGATVNLYAVRGGVTDTTPTQTTTTTGSQSGANGYVYNYIFNNVLPGSYVVTASKQGLRSDPTQILVAVVTGTESQNNNFTLTPPKTYGAGVQLVSAPADYSNVDPRSIFGLATTDPNYSVFKVADYNGTSYNIAPNLPLQRGRGYFVQFGAASSVLLATVPTQATGSFTRDLVAGWNLIGHPFYDFNNIGLVPDIDITNPNAVSVTDLSNNKVYSANDAAAAGLVRNTLYSFTGSLTGAQYVQGTVIQPWFGYWIRAFKPVRLTFTNVGRAALLPTRGVTLAQKEQTRFREIITRGAYDWRLQIGVQQGNLLDTDNTIGISPAAKDGFDYQFDNEKPPMITQTPTVYLALQGKNETGRAANFADYVQGPGTGTRSWDFTVTAGGAGDVTVFWPNINRLPRGLQPVLVDVTSGRRVSMRSSGSSYRFTPSGRAAHPFRIEVGPASSQPLAVLNIKTTSAGVGRGQRISFTTTQEADVTVEVRTLSNRVMRHLQTRAQALIETSVSWDGRSEDRTSLPSGLYVVSIQARDANGNIARSQVPVSVVQ